MDRPTSGARSAGGAMGRRAPDPDGQTAMAKSQLKGNKEAKKPKQEKPKTIAAAPTTADRLNAGTGKAKGPKK